MTENLTLEQDGYHCVADRVGLMGISLIWCLMDPGKFKLWWIRKRSPTMEGAFDSYQELIHPAGCVQLSARD